MFLMTQSLLSAYAYQFSCNEGCEDDAKAEFERTLLREKSEPTVAMMNGIEFEAEVYKLSGGYRRKAHKEWESGIQQVAAFIRGASVQVKVQRTITVDGIDFLLYGVLDALKAGTIYDVKFKNKSFAALELAGNYLNSPQHPAYFYMVPEAYRFEYLVSDGQDLYKETYTPEASPFIGDIIHDFLNGLTPDQVDVYREKWVTK